MEYSRAADDTTYGIQSLAEVKFALQEERDRSGRAPDNTTFGISFSADANVTQAQQAHGIRPCRR